MSIPYSIDQLLSLVWDTHHFSNLISPGRIQRTHHTSDYACSLSHSVTIIVHQAPSLLSRQKQYGMRSLPDTSAYDMQRESNSRPLDLASNTLLTGPHAPICSYVSHIFIFLMNLSLKYTQTLHVACMYTGD